jgi:acetyl esterase/lipase
LDYVDPEHIYLGGHSTGGTLALLVAEYSDRFRSVFSFGPIADISKYGTDSVFLPFETSIPNELKVRSPIHWLSSVKKPTWVFEGTVKANINALRIMAKTTDNPNIHFIEIKDANHFSGLAPTQELIAKKIIQDTGELNNISITEDEVNRNFIQ